MADLLERVELDPRVCAGTPVIRGTRIPIAVILDQLAGGESWESVIENYPALTAEDIQAALVYARLCVEHTDVTPVTA